MSSARSVLLAVGFAVFVAADDLTVVTTMLRPIITDLGLVLPDGLDDAAWVVNAYLIAFVAVMPIAGRLSDVYGRRRVFVAAYSLFLVGSVVIPLAPALGPFLAGRVLTALGGGAMVPVALAVVADVYPERGRSRALGLLAGIETLGWVWGPLYGAALVRFFDWRLQFWLNIPLALVGLVWVWRALADHPAPVPGRRVDWAGAGLLTGALISVDLALLGGAEVQSVSGLDELGGGPAGAVDFRWLWLAALGFGWGFVVHQRDHADPVLERGLLRGRSVLLALAVNLVVGVALVVAMVDVPIFVNAVELDVEQAAVGAGLLLAALTAAMAGFSSFGGHWAERVGRRRPIVVGTLAVVAAYAAMGMTWAPSSSRPAAALMLAVLGAGLGLTVAPTTAAVVDDADPDLRGGAAATVMVARLLGLSVGLAALTAWALARFNTLRTGIVLPPLDDPGYRDALIAAQGELTADAIGETFLATAAIAAVAVALGLGIRARATDPSTRPAIPEQTMEPTAALHAGIPRPLERRSPVLAGALVAVLGVALVASVVWTSRLAGDLDQARDEIATVRADLDTSRTELDATRADLARVEAGAALYAGQVQGYADRLIELQPTVDEGLDGAIDGIESFAGSTLDFTVAVDETVVIDTDVVIRRTVRVPITTEIPIEQTIDTTIEVGGPFGLTVPVDVSVPVDVVVPIDVEVAIPIDETVPVRTEVPIAVDVPIAIEVADTDLAPLAQSLADGLRRLQEVLAGIES